MTERSMLQSCWFGVRHPRRWMRELCGGEAAFPLVVLFGLNAVDELDRTAFGILLPEIRDEFGIDIQTALTLVALSAVAALALQVPIAQWADRTNRIPLVVFGALTWGLFSGMTGLASGLILLTIARSGSALGKAVIDPTHNSLIADYYPIESRSRVYSFHRAANAVGAFVGPLSAGLLAYYLDWRVPFLVFVIPTAIFAFLAMGLRDPVRAGGSARRRAPRRRSSTPRKSRLRSPRAGGPRTRSSRCNGSGGACRSSPPR
jgi:MFS family permease